MTGKPCLPYEFQMMLPKELVHHIQTFVPPNKKEVAKTPSPSLLKELTRIQTTSLRGKCGMYMKELDDFLLD